MKIGWMPCIMWAVFKPSFKRQIFVLGISDASMVMESAKSKYQNIIAGIPPFGKHDVLLINLLSAAMLAAVYLSLEKQPSLEQVAKYYDAAMSDNFVMRTYALPPSRTKPAFHESIFLEVPICSRLIA